MMQFPSVLPPGNACTAVADPPDAEADAAPCTHAPAPLTATRNATSSSLHPSVAEAVYAPAESVVESNVVTES